MKTLVVIPARWGSTRLPGKPLLPIARRTLLHRVIAIAQHAAMDRDVEVVVATDDERIVTHASEAGCNAVMTASSLMSGSDRTLAAAAMMPTDLNVPVISLQGDAPFIPSATVTALIDALSTTPSGCVTPVVPLDWVALDAMRERKAISPFSGTTCVRDASGRALWFSKAIIPMIRNEPLLRGRSQMSPVVQHLGIYGFTRDALIAFCALPPSPHECFEGLEQLRLLEAGIPVQTIAVAPGKIQMSGIDCEDDVVTAETLIARFGDPHDHLITPRS